MQDPSSQYTMRRAVPSDAEQLGIIAPACYAQSYEHLWDDPASYSRHLQSFSAGAFAELLDEADAAVWIAQKRGDVVGYLTLRLGSADPLEQRSGGGEIPRIYLLGPARGQGLARLLLAEAEARARQCGLRYLWLDVMDSATRVQEVYRSWGFEKIGTVPFPPAVRPELATLVVMRKILSADAIPPSSEQPG